MNTCLLSLTIGYSTYISEECQLAVSLIEEEKTVKAFVRDHNGIKSLTYPFDRVDGPWWKFWRRFTRKRRVLEMIRPDATSSRVQKCKSSKLRQALLTLDRKLVGAPLHCCEMSQNAGCDLTLKRSLKGAHRQIHVWRGVPPQRSVPRRTNVH